MRHSAFGLAGAPSASPAPVALLLLTAAQRKCHRSAQARALTVTMPRSVQEHRSAHGPEGANALATARVEPENRYDASFVGRVEGTDALIGITPYEGNLLAYVGDGDPAELGSDAGISAWLQGPVTNGTFDLSRDDGVRLQGEQTAVGFTGTVTLEDGSVHAFTAIAAEDDEGLYREWITSSREQGGIDIGWVRFDGLTTGAARALAVDDIVLECQLRPASCPVLRPTSTVTQLRCPPRPPRDCAF